MSIKLKRYHANESDFKATGRNRTEVNVLSDIGFTDLTSSRAVADMHIDVLQGTTPVTLPATFGNGEMVGAQSLIKNTRTVSQKFGLLNEKRNQNVIHSNVDWYLKSRAQEDAESVFGASTNVNYGFDRLSGLPDSPFVSYVRPVATEDGVTTPSSTRRAEIPIELKHVTDFASIAQFPNIVSDLTFNVEFEDTIPVVAPAKMPNAAPVPCDNRAAVGSLIGHAAAPLTLSPNVNTGYWRAPKLGDICTAIYNQADPDGQIWTPDDIEAHNEIVSVTQVGNKYVVVLSNGFPTIGATSDVTEIFLYYTSPNDQHELNSQPNVPVAEPIAEPADVGTALNPLVFTPNSAGGLSTVKDGGITDNDVAFGSCPWYVGAPVTMMLYDDVEAPSITRLETTITALNVAENGNLEVILDTAVTVTVGAPFISLCYRDSYDGVKFTCNWNIDEFYLELFKINLLPSQIEKAIAALEKGLEIPYVDQLLVQKNMQSTTVHSETLQSPPNTIGCSLLSPNNLTLLSHFDNLSNYRWSLNGKEVTNQAIVVGGSGAGRQIHNIMLKSHFGNMGLALKKYDAPNVCYTTSQDMHHSLIPVIIPMVPAETLVQVTLVANDAQMSSKNLFFVFHINRVLKVSKGMVKVL